MKRKVLTVGVCGWYHLWTKRIIEGCGFKMLWAAESVEAAERYLQSDIPDLLIVWQSWGQPFIALCVASYMAKILPPRVLIVSRCSWSFDLEIAYQRARVSGMVNIAKNRDLKPRLLAASLKAIARGKQHFAFR